MSSLLFLQAAEVLTSQASPKLDILSFGITVYEIISNEALPGSGIRWKWLRTYDVRGDGDVVAQYRTVCLAFSWRI